MLNDKTPEELGRIVRESPLYPILLEMEYKNTTEIAEGEVQTPKWLKILKEIENEAKEPLSIKQVEKAKPIEDNKNTGYIYFIQNEDNNLIKIGYAKNVQKRIVALQTPSTSKLILLGNIPGNFDFEKRLHKRFHGAKKSGEWFRPTFELLGYIYSMTHENMTIEQ